MIKWRTSSHSVGVNDNACAEVAGSIVWAGCGECRPTPRPDTSPRPRRQVDLAPDSGSSARWPEQRDRDLAMTMMSYIAAPLKTLAIELFKMLDNVMFWLLLLLVAGPLAAHMSFGCVKNDTATLMLNNRYILVVGCWIMIVVTSLRLRRRHKARGWRSQGSEKTR